jgi:peptidoglycan/LPS O-acetylase OafA/YrhL
MRRLPAVVLGSAAVLAMAPFAAHVAIEGGHDFAWGWAVRIAGGFLAGALASMCVRKISVGPRTAQRATVVAGAAIVQVLVVVWWAVQDGGDYAGIAVVVFPVLVGALALADGGPARWLSVPWVVMGGRISFALYLVHECIFEVFWTGMDVFPVLGPDSRWQALVSPLVLVSTVPAAYLLWRYVEEPSRRAMRDLAKRRRGAPVGPAAVTARTPDAFVPELPPVPEPRRRAQEELVNS